MRTYHTLVPPEEDIMTVEVWNETKNHEIFNNDGNGYWMKNGKESSDEVFSSPQEDATHVVWYSI